MDTQKEDQNFILFATLVWLAALAATSWEFLRIRRTTYRFNPLNLAGLVACVAGVTLRISARRALGRHFSYRLKLLPNHQLVQQGPYKYIRHPAYLGDLIFQSGLTLLFSSLSGFLLMQFLIPCFLYRIQAEERMLERIIGEAYQLYKAQTKKLLPFIY